MVFENIAQEVLLRKFPVLIVLICLTSMGGIRKLGISSSTTQTLPLIFRMVPDGSLSPSPPTFPTSNPIRFVRSLHTGTYFGHALIMARNSTA